MLLQNTPFISKDINSGPLSTLNDGFNELIIQRSNAGRIPLGTLLIQQDSGDYFNERGDIKPSLHLEYTKCRTWRLDPTVKAPRPLEDPLLLMSNSNIAIQHSQTANFFNSGAGGAMDKSYNRHPSGEDIRDQRTSSQGNLK